MKLFLTGVLLLATHLYSYSQVSCCSGAGANYAILPNLNKNVIGARYSFRNYISETHMQHSEHQGHQITVPVKEQLNSLEIFGRFNLTPRLQLSVFVPVNFIRQQSAIGNRQTAGLGDMSFLWQYNVLNPVRCSANKTKHQLRLGAGTKLPSGLFEVQQGDKLSTNLQPGTGSVDFLGSIIYTFRCKGFGFNANAAYKLNTANTKGYRFGNKTQAGMNLFYVCQVKSVQLMPSAGFNYEHQTVNRYNKEILINTGGDFLAASVGFDVYYQQFAFSSSFSTTVMNRVNGTAESTRKLTIEAGIFYNFLIPKKQTN